MTRRDLRDSDMSVLFELTAFPITIRKKCLHVADVKDDPIRIRVRLRERTLRVKSQPIDTRGQLGRIAARMKTRTARDRGELPDTLLVRSDVPYCCIASSSFPECYGPARNPPIMIE